MPFECFKSGLGRLNDQFCYDGISSKAITQCTLVIGQ